MWISNTATTALMVPIANSVIVELVRNNRRSDIHVIFLKLPMKFETRRLV